MINSGRWDYSPSVALFIPLKRFQRYLNPEYRITVPMDITHFRKEVRSQGWSMTLSMNYAVARCANESEWLLVITQETET